MRYLHAMLAVLAGTLSACATSLPPDVAPPKFGGGYAVGPAGAASAGPFDGLYAGTATVDLNMDFSCAEQMAIGGFRVDGSQIRFGGFRGAVRPDGWATLQFGQSYANGQFANGAFHGQITIDSGLLNYREYCIYKVELRRIAA